MVFGLGVFCLEEGVGWGIWVGVVCFCGSEEVFVVFGVEVLLRFWVLVWWGCGDGGYYVWLVGGWV